MRERSDAELQLEIKKCKKKILEIEIMEDEKKLAPLRRKEEQA